MGVDFSHGKAHWGYYDFNCFLERLAVHIGVHLLSKFGWYSNGETWTEEDDPIFLLVNLSGRDSFLGDWECARIAPRLRRIVDGWPHDYDRENALELAAGMEAAAAANEWLEFC